ncbi:MAG: sulfotransferase domain-containing protein [candidate division KSB1 bacterium]|nr:sulfotransferase domain-containing protein [candidate division KSB1 bacterium]MDZ7275621.1 sulfotransferase domain-containing protein [candidate division KSB1 bacterium]MDZ7284688.1 sulfotransferase domain-containing protein [candidate division KSB1 bacterium]MDZ7297893.1 sulfotransferase domain-containing protein [candidate division KSB1 bacterium]MDZ7305979.1 sulfotransferase domain-containing protein [candidate division KSB1 bacterium]
MKDESRQVWVAGYPRSGNTWVNYLCAYCLNLPFRDFDDGRKQPRQEWVRQAVAGRHPWPAPAGFAGVQKTHKLPAELPLRSGCAIYVQRDPRDVFVSHSYYMQHRVNSAMKKFHYKLLGLRGRRAQLRWFIADWRRHVTAWRDHAQATIHYEALLQDGARHLADALATAGFEVPLERAAQALECFRFEKMSGREIGTTINEKSFFRRGGVGDWRNHLSEDENRLFAELLAGARMA